MPADPLSALPVYMQFIYILLLIGYLFPKQQNIPVNQHVFHRFQEK